MRGRYLVVATAVIVVSAVPALAAPPVQDNFNGTFAKKADKKAVMGLAATYKHGKVVKVTKVEWDGFLCVKGHEGFTGGTSGKPFAVKNGAFHGKRSVSFKAAPQVTAKVKGEFVSNKKVKGKITLGASCSWTDKFTAKKTG
jgi:hypothetical protein